MSTLLHLVYIHGFQGNDTSFQAFPLHLQERLSSRIPTDSLLRVESSLYPTYKSAKPLVHATRAFLEWLSTQPEGPVILMGHSMGGLLAAEAALSVSNRTPGHRPKRIVGVVAFDTPYLGMHPHVVVSGIASLLPKEPTPTKSERELNEHPEVHVVEPRVTEDWEDFKKKIHYNRRGHSPAYLDLPSKSYNRSPSPSILSASPPPSSQLQTSRSPSPIPFMDRALDFIASQTDSAEDPFVRWFRKHADDPLRASKRWVTEKLQFGGCMFDPPGLKDRYIQLTAWNGLWINYWTETVPKDSKHTAAEQSRQEGVDNDEALVAAGIVNGNSNQQRRSRYDRLQKAFRTRRDRDNDSEHSSDDSSNEVRCPPRHFVILPKGLGRGMPGGMERWEKVQIAGVHDEVEAHTGLFNPISNLGYDAFVDVVANQILKWAEVTLVMHA